MTFEQVVDYFGGSLTEAAKALGVPLSTLSDWRHGVPYGRQCQIQIATLGKLQAEKIGRRVNKQVAAIAKV